MICKIVFRCFAAMRDEIVSLLYCPLSGEKLSLSVIERNIHPVTKQDEVYAGYLIAAHGGCYPIIKGIPRLLPESFETYTSELGAWCPDFEDIRKRIHSRYGDAIKFSAIQNGKIQKTFGFEWNLLRKSDQLKIWDLDPVEYKKQLERELQLPEGYHASVALDAGCGHGRSARLLSKFCDTTIGAEVSAAVELAYEQNDAPNCHFIQAAVDYLPFAKQTFDLVYSSGVLHHNPSTQKSLTSVSKLVKTGGLLSIWLYHPYANALHNLMRKYRSITTRLPVEFVYYFNAVTITPFQWLVSQIIGKKKKWTEIAIEELDMLTPAYRHEHTATEVKTWIQHEYQNIEITDSDKFGFSIKGEKK